MNEIEGTNTMPAAAQDEVFAPTGIPNTTKGDDSLPYEFRILKALAGRVFGSKEYSPSGARKCSGPAYSCTYSISHPLITHYVHYFEQDRFQVRYRLGLTDTYLRIPKTTIDSLVSGKSTCQTLYDTLVSKEVPIWRPLRFIDPGNKQPTGEYHLRSMETLIGNIPSQALPHIDNLLSIKDILVMVVPERKTKIGDCRRLSSRVHVITLNKTDNALSFLLTLLHELAHALAPRTDDSKPHGMLWKLMFANLIADCIRVFPVELTPYLTLLASNPPSGRDICEQHVTSSYRNSDFKGQTFAGIGYMRAMIQLERMFGPRENPPNPQGTLGNPTVQETDQGQPTAGASVLPAAQP